MAKSRARTRADKALSDKRNPGAAKAAARRKAAQKPEGPAHLGPSSEKVNEVLFPLGQKVALSNGDHVEVKPWSIRMFGEMAQRIPNTMAAAIPDDEGNVMSNEDVAGLFVSLTDEVVAMVAQTCGLTEEEVHEQMSFDDLLRVALAVWDVCIAAPMVKIGGLMGRVMGTVQLGAAVAQKRTPTQPPSSSPATTS